MQIFAKLWPDQRTLWRWHFLAGLFCLPFVAFLSLTGTVYLFKPQIDRWIDWPYDHMPAVLTAMPEQDVQAALAAVPGSRFLAYELPPSRHSAARVLVTRRDGEAVRIYVNQNTHTIMKTIVEENRFERLVFHLHGQLLLGNVGSIMMEMVASWTIVLVVTGLLLWWPRGNRKLAGVLYPRIGLSGRARWRDLHAVTGVWTSCFLVLFLVSGLPWSFVWGHALQSVENTVGRLTSVKDWEIGSVPARVVIAGHPVPVTPPAHHHDDMPGMDMPDDTTPQPIPAGLSTVVQAAVGLSLPAPVLITPSGTTWTVRSETQNRPLRTSISMTPDGQVVARTTFAQKNAIDRMIAYGVAAHEGQLFGWVNQAINLLVALGLLLMSWAATLLWIRSRPAGSLGVPPPLPSQRLGVAGPILLAILAVLLPELGASLLLLALAAWVLRHTRTL